MRPDVAAQREQVRTEVHQLDDQELVEAAYDEYWRSFGRDESVSAALRLNMLGDLDEATTMLQEQGTMEARGRLRSFLFTARLRSAESDP